MPSFIQSRGKRVCILVVGIMFSSCQSAGKLVVAPESTIENIVFVLSAWSAQTPGKLKAVYVYRCIEHGREFPEFGERVWAASVTPGLESPMVGHFTYGKNFAGLTTSHGPERLASGCYIAQAYADFPDPRAAVTVFRISLEGVISSANV